MTSELNGEEMNQVQWQGKGAKPMTEAQKATTFDLLRMRRVIVVRKGKRYINGKEGQATWIEHGNTKEIVVGDFVTTLEEEAAY